MLWTLVRAAQNVLSPDSLAELAAAVSRTVPRSVAHHHLRRVLAPLQTSQSVLDPHSAQRLAQIFAASSYPEGAEDILTFAHSSGTELNEYIYENVVQQLIKARRWRNIPSVLSLAQRQNLRTTRRLLNWRIKSLIEMKHFSLLDQVIQDFTEAGVLPNRSTYHMLIKGHILNNNSRQARESLDWMVNSGFPITPETHSAILSVYHRTLGPDGGVEAMALDSLRGLEGGLGSTIINNLIRSRIAARDSVGAFNYLQMFDFSACPDAIPILQEAFRVVDPAHVPSKRHAPNQDTFRVILQFLSDKVPLRKLDATFQIFRRLGLSPDSSIASSLILALGRSGYLADAAGILAVVCRENADAVSNLERVIAHRIVISTDTWLNFREVQPDLLIFNSFFEALLRAQGLKQASAFFHCMAAIGILPDDHTLSILSWYLSKEQDIRPRDLLREINNLATSVSMNLKLSHLNIVLRSLIRQQSVLIHQEKPFSPPPEAGVLAAALRDTGELVPSAAWASDEGPPAVRQHLLPLLRTLRSTGSRTGAVTLALSMRYNSVIRSDLRAAERVLQIMQERNIRPNINHYISLAEGYVAYGDMKQAEAVLQRMRAAGVSPNVVLYTMIITGYGRAGQPRAARSTFDAMVGSGIAPDWAAVDATAYALYRNRAGDEAKEFLLTTWRSLTSHYEGLEDEDPRTVLKRFRELRSTFQSRAYKGNHIGLRQTRLRIRLRGVRVGWREAFQMGKGDFDVS